MSDSGFELLGRVAMACETTLHAEEKNRYGFLVVVVDLADQTAAVATNGETESLKATLRELLERLDGEHPHQITVPIN